MLVNIKAPNRVRKFLQEHPDPTRVWKIWDVQKAMEKETPYTYAYGTIQGALSKLCKAGFLLRPEKGLYQIRNEEDMSEGATSKRHHWKYKTTKSAPIEAVHYPDQGVAMVTDTHYKKLCSDSEELARFKAVLKEAQTENEEKVVAAVRKLVDDPGPTKLKHVHWKDVPAKINPSSDLMVTDLKLSIAMEAALVTNLTYLPRATATALCKRKLIYVETNIEGIPYAKTPLGHKVTQHLKKQGKRFDHKGYPLR